MPEVIPTLSPQVITEFCKTIGADGKVRQGLIRVAKSNGGKLVRSTEPDHAAAVKRCPARSWTDLRPPTCFTCVRVFALKGRGVAYPTLRDRSAYLRSAAPFAGLPRLDLPRHSFSRSSPWTAPSADRSDPTGHGLIACLFLPWDG